MKVSAGTMPHDFPWEAGCFSQDGLMQGGVRNHSDIKKKK